MGGALIRKNTVVDAEVKGLRKEVLKAKDTFKKMNKGTATLNEVPVLTSVGSSGIGFDSSSKSKTNDKPKIVLKKDKTENLGKTEKLVEKPKK